MLGEAGACASRAYRRNPERSIPGEPGNLSAAGTGFLPEDDAGQFTINLKVPTGTRIELTNEYVAKVEDLIRHEIEPRDFKRIVSKIGVVPDFSSLYTTNLGPIPRPSSATQRIAPSQQLRVYGPGQKGDRPPVSRYSHILFQRLDGRRHSEFGARRLPLTYRLAALIWTRSTASHRRWPIAFVK